jgi:hypothetical protein
MCKIYCFFILFFVVAGCSSKNSPPLQQLDLSKYTEMNVVDARSLDGCSFLLEDNSAVRYQPVNLPDSVAVDGKKIFVLFVDEKNKMTTCMGGRLIRITDVKVLKK